MIARMPKTLGQICYDAYAGTRGWRAHDGALLPSYEAMLTDPKRAILIPAWEAAGAAVREALGPQRVKVPIGGPVFWAFACFKCGGGPVLATTGDYVQCERCETKLGFAQMAA